MLALVGSADAAMSKKKRAKAAPPSRDECAFRQARHSRIVCLVDTRNGDTLAYIEPDEGAEGLARWRVERCDNGWRSDKPLTLARAKKLALTLLTAAERPVAISPAAGRVVSTIANMLKSGQITDRQGKAAEAFRLAYHTIGGAGGACDFDRARGRGAVDGPQGQDAMLAASKLLRLGRAALAPWPEYYLAVELVAGAGYSISEAARCLYGDPTKTQKRKLGESLRSGLTGLANLWDPAGHGDGEARLRAWRSELFDEVPGDFRYLIDHEACGKAVVTHATARKIYRK